MTKSARRILLSTVLLTAACGSSKSTNNDAGTAGTGGSGGSTGTAGGSGTTGTAGDDGGVGGITGLAGTTGTAGSDGGAAGTTGNAGSDGGAGTIGSAGSDGGAGTTGGAGSDGGAGSAPSDGGTAGTSGSQPITATTGGSVSASGAALKIPAAALAADTTMTIAATAPTAATPQQATVVGSVFEIGPTGTTFSKPVSLTLPVAGAPAAGKRFVISVIDAGAWVDLPSVAANGKVYASLSHLSTYAVRSIDVAACTGYDTKVRCGTGTLTGTWTVSAFCNADIDTTEFPPTDKLLAACDDTAQATPVTGGSITMNADMTMTTNIVQPSKGLLSGTLAPLCVGAAASCDAVAGQILAGNPAFVDASCTGTPAAGCSCTAVYKMPVLPASTAGTYTATNKLGFSTGIPARFFCVDAQATPQTLSYAWGSTSSVQFGWILTK